MGRPEPGQENCTISFVQAGSERKRTPERHDRGKNLIGTIERFAKSFILQAFDVLENSDLKSALDYTLFFWLEGRAGDWVTYSGTIGTAWPLCST